MSRRAILLGGTGLIGAAVMKLLCRASAYTEVVVISRRAATCSERSSASAATSPTRSQPGEDRLSKAIPSSDSFSAKFGFMTPSVAAPDLRLFNYPISGE